MIAPETGGAETQFATHAFREASERAVNEWIGRIAGALLTTTLLLFRAVHYEHHSHTNDPRRDPDFVVAPKPRWLLPLWCVVHFYGRGLARSGRAWCESVAYDVAHADPRTPFSCCSTIRPVGSDARELARRSTSRASRGGAGVGKGRARRPPARLERRLPDEPHHGSFIDSAN